MFVHVMGPNLPTDGPTFHVHIKGCADVKRSPLYWGTEHANDRKNTVEVDSLVELAAYIYDFEEHPEELIGDFKVFACAADLPSGV